METTRRCEGRGHQHRGTVRCEREATRHITRTSTGQDLGYRCEPHAREYARLERIFSVERI